MLIGKHLPLLNAYTNTHSTHPSASHLPSDLIIPSRPQATWASPAISVMVLTTHQFFFSLHLQSFTTQTNCSRQQI